MIAIGKSLASMHMKDIIHGDLTTSNMMLRPKIGSVPNYEIVSSANLHLMTFSNSPSASPLESTISDTEL